MLKNTTHGRGERKCPCVLQTESKFEAIFFCEMRPLLPIFVSCVDSNASRYPRDWNRLAPVRCGRERQFIALGGSG